MTAKDYLLQARGIESEVSNITCATDSVAMIVGGFPTLGLRVKGILHKGWVYIQKIGDCTYDIQLVSAKTKEVKKEIENIEQTMLGQTLAKVIGQ